MLSPRAIQASVLMALTEWDWPPDPRFLACAPISHAVGMMVLPVLMQGGAIVLADGFHPKKFGELVKAEAVSATFLVPTMIYALLADPAVVDDDLRSLKTIIYGASAMDPHRLQAAMSRWGDVFVQLYGQTEAPNAIAALRKVDHKIDDIDRLASCGVATSASHDRAARCRRRRGGRWRMRRDLRARPPGHGRVLEAATGDGRDPARRVAAHRRRGEARRRRLPHHR